MSINQESSGYAPPSVGLEVGDDEEEEIEINIVPQGNGKANGNGVDAATLNTLPPPKGATSAFASPATTFSSPAPAHVSPSMSRAAPETFSPLHQEAFTAPPPTTGLPSVDYSRGHLDNNPGPGARDNEPSKLMFMWWMCLAVMMLMTFAIACSAVSMANTNRSEQVAGVEETLCRQGPVFAKPVCLAIASPCRPSLASPCHAVSNPWRATFRPSWQRPGDPEPPGPKRNLWPGASELTGPQDRIAVDEGNVLNLRVADRDSIE